MHVAVGESGAAAVWWEEIIEGVDPPDRNWSYVAYTSPGGMWERAHLLVDRQRHIPSTLVSIDTRGDLDAVYSTRAGLWMTHRDAEGGWVGGRKLIAAHGGGEHQMMHATKADIVVVAWATDDGIAARRRTNGRWESILRWKAPTANWTFDAAMDGPGNVTFAWFSLDYSVIVRRWPCGRAMEPQRTLIGPQSASTMRDLLQITAGPSGEAIVWFGEYQGAGTFGAHALLGSRDGTWGFEQVLGPYIDDLVVRPSGAVEAVWVTDRARDKVGTAIHYATLNPP
jgi:hypothetical protein